MELISGFFFVVVIGIISYVFTRKEKPHPDKDEKIAEMEEHKELERRQEILAEIENFLAGALFFEHIGNWHKEKVYKYISNQGKMYEFEEFMSEDNQKVGINEQSLCFKRMAYKRNDSAIEKMFIVA